MSVMHLRVAEAGIESITLTAFAGREEAELMTNRYESGGPSDRGARSQGLG